MLRDASGSTRAVDLGPLVSDAPAPARRAPRRAPPAATAATRREILAVLRTIARDFEFELVVPGQHRPSGLSNQAILAIRTREGRLFGDDTKRLHDWVRAVLIEEFDGAGRVPSPAVLRQVISSAIVEWVLKRVEHGGVDVKVAPLTPAYAARKAAAGYGDEPIGVRTGAWRDAVRDRARADVTLPTTTR